MRLIPKVLERAGERLGDLCGDGRPAIVRQAMVLAGAET